MSRQLLPSVLLVCSLTSFSAVAAPDGGTGLIPPVIVDQVPAGYPLAAQAAHQEGTSVLIVTVDERGAVSNAEVSESGGELFDHAALEAIRKWRFKPGTRDGRAIPMRLQIPFNFAINSEDRGADAPVETPTTDDAFTQIPAPDAGTPASDRPQDVPMFSSTVRARKQGPLRATSDFVMDRAVLTAAPHKSAADLLGTAPGIYISAPEGDAVAHEIYLRGFNAEHGQDIELKVGPIPVNQPSHIHGQGYSDLNFIIPEVVHSVRVTEGVYDPKQGDFAVAGSANFELGVAERGVHTKTSYGSFNQFRQLVLWAPRDEPEETFGAVSFQRTDGFGTNRGSMSASGLGQLAFNGPMGTKGLLFLGAYGARASLAGVLRRDDIDSGYVDFYGTYPQPTATSQAAFNSRFQAAVTLEKTHDSGARTEATLWAQLIDFRGRFNFTGFLERSNYNPNWVGYGDLVEQSNKDNGVGLSFLHRPARAHFSSWANATFELGVQARTDGIEQQQNLLRPPENETWDRRIDASIRSSDLGAYVDVDAQLGRYLHLRGGVRADALFMDVDDRLGNLRPTFMAETYITGYRRTALGLAVGPRASLEFQPLTWLQILASYGEGYRSPQALQLGDGENAPYAKVRGYEVGFRIKPEQGERLTVTGAAYRTTLSSDLAFDPGEASLQRIGPTLRQGGVLQVFGKPTKWLLGSLSATYVHATLTSPPTASASDPNPAFQPGQLLPYVPPLVLRADLAGEYAVSLKSSPLTFRLGVGASYLSARPLPYGRFANPVALLDGTFSARWRFIEVSVDAFNLLNSRYAATEYTFVSDWGNRPAPTLVPARHISAGAPRTFLGSVSLHF